MFPYEKKKRFSWYFKSRIYFRVKYRANKAQIKQNSNGFEGYKWNNFFCLQNTLILSAT